MSTSGRLALVAAAFFVLAIDPVLSTARAGDGGPVSRRGTYAGGSYLIEVPAGWNGGLVIDYSRRGNPIGIEITAPAKLSTTALNRVLRRLGVPTVTRADLAPLRAA